MSRYCPEGHLSEADDYCDTCGSPMTGTVSVPAESETAGRSAAGEVRPASDAAGAADAPGEREGAGAGTADAADAAEAAEAQVCPNCSTRNLPDALFCEGCGYDFTTGALPRPIALAEGSFVDLEVPGAGKDRDGSGDHDDAADSSPALSAPSSASSGSSSASSASSGSAAGPASPEVPPADEGAPREEPAHEEPGQTAVSPGQGSIAREPEPTVAAPEPDPTSKEPEHARAAPEPSMTSEEPEHADAAPEPAPESPSGAQAARDPGSEGPSSAPSDPADRPEGTRGSHRPAYVPPSRKLGAEWVVEVWIDPTWYAGQDSADPCPSPAVPDIVRLRRASALIGRPSASRNLHPDIDCGTDTGVSRRQASLTSDGRRWWVEDLGSSNGTYVGPASGPLPQEPVAPGRRVEVDADDRIYVGAWTRLVVRKATEAERAHGG